MVAGRWTRRAALCGGSMALAIGVLGMSPGAAGAQGTSSGGVVLSDEVYTTSTTCSNTAALRSATELLDDAWRASNAGSTIVVGDFGAADGAAPNPTTADFPGIAITADVSKYDVSAAVASSTDSGSWGTLAAAGNGDPALSASPTLQDCAPRPASLYGAPHPAFWNATAGSGSSLDAVMVEFSEPVAAFGAWFGDVETRTDGDGTPARVKLFAADGSLLSIDSIVPTRQTPPAGDPSGRTTCGGPSGADALACGNQATRFIAFDFDTAVVSRMLVIVGDDDSCIEFPGDCDGGSEHLSMVGMLLADNPPTTTTTAPATSTTAPSTTAPSTTSTSTSTTTVATAPSTTATTMAATSSTSVVAPTTTVPANTSTTDGTALPQTVTVEPSPASTASSEPTNSTVAPISTPPTTSAGTVAPAGLPVTGSDRSVQLLAIGTLLLGVGGLTDRVCRRRPSSA